MLASFLPKQGIDLQLIWGSVEIEGDLGSILIGTGSIVAPALKVLKVKIAGCLRYARFWPRSQPG